MHQRANETPGPRAPVVAPRASRLVRIVYVWTIGVVILGTLVTASGPHGGDNQAKRLAIPIADLARVHGTAVDLLVILTLVTAWVLGRTRAPRVVLNTISFVIGVMIAQGVLGYVQYFKGVPPVLVGFHVFGAVIVFGAVQQLVLSLEARVDVALADDGALLRVSAPVRDPVA
jgi:cytochrome c oxidase assembly protein subunit 15